MRQVLGISKTRQWRKAKEAIENGVKSFSEFLEIRLDSRLGNPSGQMRNRKQFCCDYIKAFVKYLNPIPDKHGTKLQQNEAIPVYELPFRGVSEFHKEMKEYYISKGWNVYSNP